MDEDVAGVKAAMAEYDVAAVLNARDNGGKNCLFYASLGFNKVGN